jgi:hypothetical protein
MSFLISHLKRDTICSCRLLLPSLLKAGFTYKLFVEFPIELAQDLCFA